MTATSNLPGISRRARGGGEDMTRPPTVAAGELGPPPRSHPRRGQTRLKGGFVLQQNFPLSPPTRAAEGASEAVFPGTGRHDHFITIYQDTF